MVIEAHKALSWSFVANISQFIISGLISFVLAALLGPEIFGVVAIATTFLLFIQMLGGQFVTSVIVQNKAFDEELKNSLFWGTLFWGGLFVLLAIAVSDFWAEFNDAPEVSHLIKLLAPTVFLKCTSFVGRGILLRSLNLKAIAIITMAAALSGGSVGLIMAYLDYGVYALVAQTWISSVVITILYWVYANYTPRFQFSYDRIKSVVFFAWGVFLNEISRIVLLTADVILVGVYFEPVIVGLYKIADRLTQIVITLISRAIASFIHPFVASKQADQAAQQRVVLNCLKLGTYMAFPCFGAMAGCSQIILSIIGEDWSAAWLGLTILCGAGALQSVSFSTPFVIEAVGKPHAASILNWSTAVVIAVGFVSIAPFVQGYSILHTVAFIAGVRLSAYCLVNFCYNLFLLHRFLAISPVAILRITAIPGVLMVSVGFLGIYLTDLFFGSLNPFVSVLVLGSILMGISIPILLFLDQDFYSLSKRLFLKVVGKIRFKVD